MLKEMEVIKEIRRRSCFLYDHENFINRLLKPLSEILPHDAQGITSIDAEAYNPRGIYYGYPTKYLNDIININPEEIRGMKRSIELAIREGYNTSTTESFGFDFKDDKAYKLIYEPHKFKHGLQTYFFSEGGGLLGFSGLTKRSSPGFTDAEIKLWDQVAPYILRAFRNYRWLVSLEFFNRSLEDMVFAALITNSKGKILWSNALAKNNIPELSSSNQLPEELKPCFNKTSSFFQGEYDPFIYREMGAPTTYGNSLCFAVDDTASHYLPLNCDGFLFIIDCNRLNSMLINSLTNRELEILRLIANGKFDKAIAYELGISPKTVNTHVGNLLKKLKASSRTEAAVKAVKLGVI